MAGLIREIDLPLLVLGHSDALSTGAPTPGTHDARLEI